MSALHMPRRTTLALNWTGHGDVRRDRIVCALLRTVNGHRTVVELESVARAMGLEEDALERLRLDGLITDGTDAAGNSCKPSLLAQHPDRSAEAA